MAANPAFSSTPHAGAILTPATLDTSLTAPTNVATVFTAGAGGSRIDVIRVIQVASTAAAGVLCLFLYDGSAYHLIENYGYGIVTLSATSSPNPADFYYPMNEFATGWSLRCTVTTAAGQSAFSVTAWGGDF